MTCADARHRLLTADLSAVRGDSDSLLREHLVDCASCAAASSSIVSGTMSLRNALVARRNAPRVRVARRHTLAMSLVPMALAAEVTMIALFSQRQNDDGSLRSVIRDSVVALAHPSPAILDTDSTVPSVAKSVRARAKRAPVASADSADSVRVRPVVKPVGMFDDDTSGMSQVRVNVAGGQRAAIIGTSNPKVTVVWISKGDSL
jgi:hypothetical protein